MKLLDTNEFRKTIITFSSLIVAGRNFGLITVVSLLPVSTRISAVSSSIFSFDTELFGVYSASIIISSVSSIFLLDILIKTYTSYQYENFFYIDQNFIFYML